MVRKAKLGRGSGISLSPDAKRLAALLNVDADTVVVVKPGYEPPPVKEGLDDAEDDATTATTRWRRSCRCCGNTGERRKEPCAGRCNCGSARGHQDRPDKSGRRQDSGKCSASRPATIAATSFAIPAADAASITRLTPFQFGDLHGMWVGEDVEVPFSNLVDRLKMTKTMFNQMIF